MPCGWEYRRKRFVCGWQVKLCDTLMLHTDHVWAVPALRDKCCMLTVRFQQYVCNFNKRGLLITNLCKGNHFTLCLEFNSICRQCVASLGAAGADRPGWYPPGGGGLTPNLKLIFLWLNFEKKHWINDVGRWEWWGDDSKKGHHFQRRWLKKGCQIFFKKK